MNISIFKAIFPMFLASITCLTSCSYIETENRVKNEIQQVSPDKQSVDLPMENTDDYDEHQRAEDEKMSAEIEKSLKNKVPVFSTVEQLHNIGDTFISHFGCDEQEFEITVNEIQEYTSLNDAGTSLSDTIIPNDEDYKDYYDLKSDTFNNGLKFIVLDITVKNISVELPNDENNVAWFRINDFSYSMADDVKWFSNHPTELSSSNYYHYSLPKGETTDFKVGWLVDMSELSLNDLYLEVGSGTSNDYKEYVYLS